ncbi:oxygenase MpaB family protein [Streptomyces sp. LBL]|uniref:oxygenase MpaB family protein n=1 Tax=Streptomyces sp. LBL TaxID=2940562 RepID=UPI002474CAAF|nr:oxygenase MpaB family protein [Streptomyces sp. LBL]
MHGDPMMWVAGVRALHLQALHPRAVCGVMQNSDFRRDAWGRLTRTANFVGTTTYGTTEAAEKAGARVRKIHSMLGATDPGTGERYDVDGPEPARELLWRRVAHLAYAALPPYAHELYGRPAPKPATVTRQLRATGTLPRCVPARVRWQLPPKHILRAMARLGPGARPAAYTLGRRVAILDKPGEGGK